MKNRALHQVWGMPILAQFRSWWVSAAQAADKRLGELHRRTTDRIALQYHRLDRLAQLEVEDVSGLRHEFRADDVGETRRDPAGDLILPNEVTPMDEIVVRELTGPAVAGSVESR